MLLTAGLNISAAPDARRAGGSFLPDRRGAHCSAWFSRSCDVAIGSD